MLWDVHWKDPRGGPLIKGGWEARWDDPKVKWIQFGMGVFLVGGSIAFCL